MAEEDKPKVNGIDARIEELAKQDKSCGVVRFLLIPLDNGSIDVLSEYSTDDPLSQAFYRKAIALAMLKEHKPE